MMRFPLGGSTEVVYLPLRRSAHVLNPAEANTASFCSHFGEASEHLARYQQAVPASAAASPDLAELAERGLLLSSGELLNRVEAFPVEAPRQLDWFAIPTRNRPAALERAVCSYASNFARFGRKPKILIADDSSLDDQAGTARAAKAGLQSAGSDLTCWYAGHNEKRRLVDLLTEGGGIPRSVVEFGLCPDGDLPKMGANRNAIQMYTAGQMVLAADDDTICQPCFAPGGSDMDCLRLGSEIDPTEFWFFPDHEAAVAAARFSDFDIADRHEQLLGRPVCSVLCDAAPGSGLDLGPVCNHLLSSLWSGQARIAVTASGSVGDSGMHSTRGLRYHEGRGTRQRLTASESDYRMAMRSRPVIRQVPCTTICHGSPFCTMFAGFDNRQLLPPFLPVCRNEDGVFACVLSGCLPGGYFGYLPWSLVHAPAGCREYDGGIDTRISELVNVCISRWNPPSTAYAEKRLQSLGRCLVELASAPPDEFRETVLFASWDMASFRVAKAEALLNAFAYSPSYWAEDVVNEIQNIAAAVTKPDFALPSDLPGGDGREDPLARAQNIVRQYGELLCWWPAMVERATELSANDHLPASRI
jgi:hypothetical protein